MNRNALSLWNTDQNLAQYMARKKTIIRIILVVTIKKTD